MKKIYALSLAIMATAFLNVFAAPIRSYQELTAAMRAGNRFVILLDFQQCTGQSSMPMGYLTPRAMMLLPATDTTPERVATSDLHFTDHAGNPTYEYVKMTIHSDNTATVRTTFYDPQSFKSIGTGHTIHCLMGEGIKIFSDND